MDEEDGGEEHADEGDAHVAPELGLDHLVRLPAGVLRAHREGAVREVCLRHDLLNFVHSGDPLRGGAEQLVGQLDCRELINYTYYYSS